MSVAAVPVIAVVEDSLMHRLCWKQWLNQECRLILCSGPRQFWNLMHADAALFASLSCVITDYYFDPYEDDESASVPDVDNGLELARQIKERRPELKILMASAVECDETTRQVFDGLIVKAPEPKELAFAALYEHGILPRT